MLQLCNAASVAKTGPQVSPWGAVAGVQAWAWVMRAKQEMVKGAGGGVMQWQGHWQGAWQGQRQQAYWEVPALWRMNDPDRSSQMVVLQGRYVVVGDGQGVSCLDEEVIVEAPVLIIMRHC